jgi:hypothetical protein
MSGHLLHVLDDLAKAWHTDQIADAAAQHYVFGEAPEWISPQIWKLAAGEFSPRGGGRQILPDPTPGLRRHKPTRM